MDALWVTLALRAGVTAAIVITAAVLAERAGPRWGGLVASLPVAAGPAFVMLAMQHPPAFIADAALGSMAANPATVIFLVVFVRLVVRHGLVVALPAGLACWLGAVLLFRVLGLGTPGVVALNLAIFSLGIALTRRQARLVASGVRPKGRPWYELPGRASLVGLLVASVVTASHALGSFASGIGAVIPVTYTSLLLVVTPRQGREAAAAVASSALLGFAGFSLGFLALHLLAVPIGSAAAMVAALAVMLAWSGGVLLLRRR